MEHKLVGVRVEELLRALDVDEELVDSRDVLNVHEFRLSLLCHKRRNDDHLKSVSQRRFFGHLRQERLGGIGYGNILFLL